MKNLFFVTIVGLLLNGIPLKAQKVFKTSAFEKYAVGIDLGTYGPGLTVATNLMPNLYLKVGVNTAGNTTYNIDLDISPDGFLPDSPENTVDLNGTMSSPTLNFTNFKAIVDYYPMKNGVFSLSAGFFIGSNNISFSGKINNYDDKNDYVFKLRDELIVKPNADGTFDCKLKFGNIFKPYFGIGLGRTIATHKPLGFKLELGVVYEGPLSFESKNAVDGNSRPVSNTFLTDSKLFDPLVLYPMLNFTLSYRLN